MNQPFSGFPQGFPQQQGQQFQGFPQQQGQQFQGFPQQQQGFPQPQGFPGMPMPQTYPAGMQQAQTPVTNYTDAVDFTNATEWVDFGGELPKGDYEVVIEGVPKKPHKSKAGEFVYHFQLAVVTGSCSGNRPLVAIGANFATPSNLSKVFTAYRSAGYTAEWIKANVKTVEEGHFKGRRAFITAKEKDPNDPQARQNVSFITPEQYQANAKMRAAQGAPTMAQQPQHLQQPQQPQQTNGAPVPAMPLPGLPGVAPSPSGALQGLI